MASKTPLFSTFSLRTISNSFLALLLAIGLIWPLNTVSASAAYISFTGHKLSRPDMVISDTILAQIFADLNVKQPDWYQNYYYSLKVVNSFSAPHVLTLYPKLGTSLVVRASSTGHTATSLNLSFYYDVYSPSISTFLTYTFNSSGRYVSDSSQTVSSGSYTLFAFGSASTTLVYYTNFPEITVMNWGRTSTLATITPSVVGGKEIPKSLQYAAYNLSGLMPGPEIADDGLIKMLQYIVSRPGFASVFTTHRYILQPDLSSEGEIIGWSFMLFPYNEFELVNYFDLLDFDGNGYQESIVLNFDGSEKGIAKFVFDINFDFVDSYASGEIVRIEYGDMPVSYTNLGAGLWFGNTYLPPSYEGWILLNTRMIPELMLDTYVKPVSFLTPNNVLPDELVLTIFKHALQKHPDLLDNYYYTLTDTVPGGVNDYIGLFLYPKTRGASSSSYTAHSLPDGRIDSLELLFNGAPAHTYALNRDGTLAAYGLIDSPFTQNVSGQKHYYSDVPVRLFNASGSLAVNTSYARASVNASSALPEHLLTAIRSYVDSDRALAYAFNSFGTPEIIADILVGVFNQVKGHSAFNRSLLAPVMGDKHDWSLYPYYVQYNAETPDLLNIVLFEPGTAAYYGYKNAFGQIASWQLVSTGKSFEFPLRRVFGGWPVGLPTQGFEKSWRVFGETTYYSNLLPVYLVEPDGSMVEVNGAEYGLKPFPSSVYDILQAQKDDPFLTIIDRIKSLPGLIVSELWLLVDYIFGPFIRLIQGISADGTVYKIFDNFKIFLESAHILPSVFVDMFSFFPEEIHGMFVTTLVISFALFVYKIYRVIRGVFV